MEAFLYDTLDAQKVRCRLCAHRCVIKSGSRGICGVRENRAGVLEALSYGRLIASHVDPIEKKPLYHFLPGSRSFSIATVGCNFKCRFCQNADIAQMPRDRDGLIMGDEVSPEAVVDAARRSGSRSIAYTYTEPTVYFEFAHDTARIAREHGIRNVFVTNGYMTEDAVEMIGPWLDAANVDLKAYDDAFYRDLCGGRLEPVKHTLAALKAKGVWLEVTTLLIPGRNDDPNRLAALAEFLATALGSDTPWHISRFHPTYQLTDAAATPLETLRTARDIGMAAGLRYVYMGNVPGHGGEDTRCWQCGETVIERAGYRINRVQLHEGRCRSCHAVIDGVGL